jgi:CBS domain-containing protein
MPTVNDVLAEKETTHVHTIAETASVWDAVEKLNRFRIGCLVVTREDRPVSSIGTENWNSPPAARALKLEWCVC